MTPTFLGRLQTRLLLFLTVGIPLTLPFAIALDGPFFSILFWLMCWGFVWDALYTLMQKFRWDRDWPAAYQVGAGIWEAFFFLLFIGFFALLGIGYYNFSLFWFLVHYSVVWSGIFFASQVLMRIFFPRWRFRGGRWF